MAKLSPTDELGLGMGLPMPISPYRFRITSFEEPEIADTLSMCLRAVEVDFLKKEVDLKLELSLSGELFRHLNTLIELASASDAKQRAIPPKVPLFYGGGLIIEYLSGVLKQDALAILLMSGVTLKNYGIKHDYASKDSVQQITLVCNYDTAKFLTLEMAKNIGALNE